MVTATSLQQNDAKQHIDALIASFDDEFEEVDDKDLPELIDA